MMVKIPFFLGIKLSSTQLTLYQKHTVFGGRWLESAANSTYMYTVGNSKHLNANMSLFTRRNISKTSIFHGSMFRSTILQKIFHVWLPSKKKPLGFLGWFSHSFAQLLTIINLSSSFGPNWGLGICHAWIVLKNLLRVCVWSSWTFRPPPWGAIAMERWGRCR